MYQKSADQRPAPRVTIAMPVYNSATTLTDAVTSILSQTYKDFELIICDDGSTDETLTIARMFADEDSRVIILRNPENLGLNVSLNNCLEITRGEFYARMDGDDISMPNRLEKLIATLDANSNIAVVSSWMTTFDQFGEWGIVRTNLNPGLLNFLTDSPFCHAPCMIRTSILRQLGGYGTAKHLRRCEDIDLWFRLYAAGHKGANIQEALYSMRDDRNARKRRTFKSRINEARVRLSGLRMLNMSLVHQLYALRPIFVGLLPGPVYDFLHRWKLRR